MDKASSSFFRKSKSRCVAAPLVYRLSNVSWVTIHFINCQKLPTCHSTLSFEFHKGHCRFGENKKKMTSGSAQRKPLPGGYHLLLSYYLAVRLRVSPRDFHPHLSIFLEKDEPWMSRTSKPNNFVAWSQPVGFPLLLIIRFAKSAETKKRGHDLGLHPYECNCRPCLTIWLFNVSLLIPLHNVSCKICAKRKSPC